MSNEVQEMIAKAKTAQQVLATYSQEQVDEIVKAVGKVIYDNAAELAEDAVEETRMGTVADKTVKNQAKSKNIWNYLNGKKSVGVIEPRNSEGMITVAKPVGVVGAVTPTTNPIVTPMCNAMFALKGANAIIIAPHPRAKNCSAKAVDLMNTEIKRLNGPDHLIQIMREPSLDLTNELMSAVDVLVATGGPAMVTAAYSSGKPSYGVGAGNVQAIIDDDADYDDAAKKIINGRIFDNGIICSGEQCVIAPEKDFSAVMDAFKNNGAFYVEDQAVADKFRAVLFEDGHISKHVVGQSVQIIAKLAGVEVPDDTRVIIIKSNGKLDDLLRKEKMCPVLTTIGYDDFNDAIAIAQANLDIEGKGHTSSIHSNNDEHIHQVGLQLPVSRVAVNEPSSLSVGGSLKNGFVPTTTLGCGSWGNNSISENFNYTHMINTQRIGFTQQDKYVPTDEEIWA